MSGPNTSTISLGVNVKGPGLSNDYAPTALTPIVNTSAPGSVPTPVVLSPGNNTVSFPAGTRTIVLYPATPSPGPNTNAKTVGGLSIDPALPFMWTPPAGTTSVVVNAVAGETVQIAFC